MIVWRAPPCALVLCLCFFELLLIARFGVFFAKLTLLPKLLLGVSVLRSFKIVSFVSFFKFLFLRFWYWLYLSMKLSIFICFSLDNRSRYAFYCDEKLPVLCFYCCLLLVLLAYRPNWRIEAEWGSLLLEAMYNRMVVSSSTIGWFKLWLVFPMAGPCGISRALRGPRLLFYPLFCWRKLDSLGFEFWMNMSTKLLD